MAAKPQFSLRLLFVVTAIVAFVLAEAVVFPRWLAWFIGFALTSLMLPAFGAGVIYAHESKRAFCIGALLWWLAFPALTGSFPLAGARLRLLDGGGADTCIFWLLTLAGGLVAVGVRCRTAGTASTQPPRSGDRI